ncbi:MAG: KamA family radical SAM protein, partial [Nitrospirae bacterium]|nr:KamA family radical SAM protein [Nitrospirota bacterium]
MFVTTSEQLYEMGYLDELSYSVSKRIEERYPIKIPMSYLDLIDKGNSGCPISMQCIPSEDEVIDQDNGLSDPIGDKRHQKRPGLLHRYPNRLLVITARECFLYCRFCFRKNFRMSEDIARHEDAYLYLSQHPEINEVILSGGDPLVSNDDELEKWFTTTIKHTSVKKIRIHTRAPVVFPQRFDSSLYALLENMPLTTVLSVHINHPAELTPECKNILVRLRKIGVVTVSQTVLLKGVNDSAEILQTLFDGLMCEGCIPYYLHHNDKVRGGTHFSDSIAHGIEVVSSLWGEISGLSIPKYVLDIPGGYGKVPIDVQKCVKQNGVYRVSGMNRH